MKDTELTKEDKLFYRGLRDTFVSSLEDKETEGAPDFTKKEVSDTLKDFMFTNVLIEQDDGSYVKFIEEKRLNDQKEFDRIQKEAKDRALSEAEEKQLEALSLSKLDSHDYYITNAFNRDVSNSYFKENPETFNELTAPYQERIEKNKSLFSSQEEYKDLSDDEIELRSVSKTLSEEFKDVAMIGLNAARFASSPVGFLTSKALCAGVSAFFKTEQGKALAQKASDKWQEVFPKEKRTPVAKAVLGLAAGLGAIALIVSGMDPEDLNDMANTVNSALDTTLESGQQLAGAIVANGEVALNTASENIDAAINLTSERSVEMADSFVKGVDNAAENIKDFKEEMIPKVSESMDNFNEKMTEMTKDMGTVQEDNAYTQKASEAMSEMNGDSVEAVAGETMPEENAYTQRANDAMDTADYNPETDPEYKNPNQRAGFEDLSQEEKDKILAETADYNPETDPEYKNPNQRAGFEDLSQEEKDKILAETADKPIEAVAAESKATTSLESEDTFDDFLDSIPESDPEVAPVEPVVESQSFSKNNIKPVDISTFDDIQDFKADSDLNSSIKTENGEITSYEINGTSINPEYMPENFKEMITKDFTHIEDPFDRLDAQMEQGHLVEKYLEENQDVYKAMITDQHPDGLNVNSPIEAVAAEIEPEVEKTPELEASEPEVEKTPELEASEPEVEKTPELEASEPEVSFPDSVEIKSGDRLESIAGDILRESNPDVTYQEIREFTQQIAEHNGLEDADMIQKGDVFEIPKADDLEGIELKEFKIDSIDDIKNFDKVPYGSDMTPKELTSSISEVLNKTYPDEPERVHEMMAYVKDSVKGMPSDSPIDSRVDLSGIGDSNESMFGANKVEISDEQESLYDFSSEAEAELEAELNKEPEKVTNKEGRPSPVQPNFKR